MQFLKILFWCLLTFVAALFTYGNWHWIPIYLWGGLVADTNLPALLLVTFLAGFLPTLAYQHAMRWRLRQRLASAERTISELRATPYDPMAEPAVLPAPASITTPPVAA